MSRQRDSSWMPLALVAGVGTLAAAGALLFTGKKQEEPPLRERDLPPPKIEWVGGVSRPNLDALAFLFASENPKASLLVWALQALSANNFARQLARSDRRITSIRDMLQSGVEKKTIKLPSRVEKKTRKRFYELGWGRQYDKDQHITRWAATSAGRTPLKVGWQFFEMAERLLLNRIEFQELRGKRGEGMPPSHEWTRMNSFLQYEGFGETVIRQAGEDAETDPDVVAARWKSRLVISVEGLRFYASGGH